MAERDAIDGLETALARARAGDRDAYRAVIAAVEPAVRVVVAAIVPERSLVDDAAQEAFVTAWRKLDEYRPGSDAVAWFRAIARYVALNARRGWVRQQELRRSYRAELERLVEPARIAAADGVDGALYATLDACIAALSDAARALVREHYWDGHAAEAIAGARGRDAGWARVALHRARASLADCLRAKGVRGG